MCFLINIDWARKDSCISGEKYCSITTTTTTTSTTTTTTTMTSTTATTTTATSTTTTFTTSTTTTTTTTTTTPEPKCQEGEVPKELRIFQTIKETQTWPECRDLCTAKGRCDYFNWKVNMNNRS